MLIGKLPIRKGKYEYNNFLSKKGFKELQKEISGLEISEKALILELKEIGRAKSRDDKLRRNDVITQLENNPIKNLYEEGYFTSR